MTATVFIDKESVDPLVCERLEKLASDGGIRLDDLSVTFVSTPRSGKSFFNRLFEEQFARINAYPRRSAVHQFIIIDEYGPPLSWEGCHVESGKPKAEWKKGMLERQKDKPKGEPSNLLSALVGRLDDRGRGA